MKMKKDNGKEFESWELFGIYEDAGFSYCFSITFWGYVKFALANLSQFLIGRLKTTNS